MKYAKDAHGTATRVTYPAPHQANPAPGPLRRDIAATGWRHAGGAAMIGATDQGNPMTVTPIYAGLLALLYLALSARVVQMRGKGMPSLGDGGIEALQRRIRGHANFAEYVPFILLMIGSLELGQLPAPWLHALGASLLVARLLHGYALSFTASFKFGRFWGTVLTFVLLAVCGVLCLCQGFAPFWLAPAA